MSKEDSQIFHKLELLSSPELTTDVRSRIKNMQVLLENYFEEYIPKGKLNEMANISNRTFAYRDRIAYAQAVETVDPDGERVVGGAIGFVATKTHDSLILAEDVRSIWNIVDPEVRIRLGGIDVFADTMWNTILMEELIHHYSDHGLIKNRGVEEMAFFESMGKRARNMILKENDMPFLSTWIENEMISNAESFPEEVSMKVLFGCKEYDAVYGLDRAAWMIERFRDLVIDQYDRPFEYVYNNDGYRRSRILGEGGFLTGIKSMLS